MQVVNHLHNGFAQRLIERAHEAKHRLIHVVVQAVHQLAVPAHRLGDRYILAGQPGERLGDIERLALEQQHALRAPTQPRVVAEVPGDSLLQGTSGIGETELGVPIPTADPFGTSTSAAPADAARAVQPLPERTAGGLVLPDDDPFPSVPQ